MTNWFAKMSCRNTKKPTKAKWFLGEECAENADVEWKGRVPRMSWIMNDKIKRWGITWRDSTPTNTSVSLGINGDLGSTLMMSHNMTLLALREVQDKFFPFALVALVAVVVTPKPKKTQNSPLNPLKTIEVSNGDPRRSCEVSNSEKIWFLLFFLHFLSFLNNLESILDRIPETTGNSVLVSFLSWFDLPLLNTSKGFPLIFRAAGFTAPPGT